MTLVSGVASGGSNVTPAVTIAAANMDNKARAANMYPHVTILRRSALLGKSILVC